MMVIVLCGCLHLSRHAVQGGAFAQQLLHSPRSPYKAQSPQSPSEGSSQFLSPASDDPPMTLPPLCTSLILPRTEARFMIPIESLMDVADKRSAQLDIQGMSG